MLLKRHLMIDLLYAGTRFRSHSSYMLSKATHLTLRYPGWNGMQLSRGQHLRAPAVADHYHLCTAEAHLPCTGRQQTKPRRACAEAARSEGLQGVRARITVESRTWESTTTAWRRVMTSLQTASLLRHKSLLLHRRVPASGVAKYHSPAFQMLPRLLLVLPNPAAECSTGSAALHTQDCQGF